MDDKIIILLVYGVPLLLYIWYKLKHRKPTVHLKKLKKFVSS